MKKLLLVTLIVVGLFLGVIVYNSSFDVKTIDHNGVHLSSSDYQAIKETFKDYGGIRVCNLKSGNCIGFLKLNPIMEN